MFPSKFFTKVATVMTILIVTLSSIQPTIAASSPDFDQAALVVRLDSGCRWHATSSTGDAVFAEGSIQGVLTSAGVWELSCAGEITSSTFTLTQAVIVYSTADDPHATCYAGPFVTHDVIMVFTPSGESHFTCWGRVS